MATKMISVRIDEDKLLALTAMYSGATLTAAVDSCITYRLSNGKQTDMESLSYTEQEGIRQLKNAYQREWNKRNPEKRKMYNKNKIRNREQANAGKERYWLKKLRAAK